jgi:hypothetical protein
MIFGGVGDLIWIVFLLLGVGFFLWRLSREKAIAAAGGTRIAGWRLVIASFMLLVLIFSGGCSLMFMPDAISGNQYVDPVAILVIGGIPFAIALLIFWLSLRRGTAPKGPTET